MQRVFLLLPVGVDGDWLSLLRPNAVNYAGDRLTGQRFLVVPVRKLRFQRDGAEIQR